MFGTRYSPLVYIYCLKSSIYLLVRGQLALPRNFAGVLRFYPVRSDTRTVFWVVFGVAYFRFVFTNVLSENTICCVGCDLNLELHFGVSGRLWGIFGTLWAH